MNVWVIKKKKEKKKEIKLVKQNGRNWVEERLKGEGRGEDEGVESRLAE